MVSITDALFGLAKRLGVQFHFETSVEEIRVESDQAKGVKTKTASYEADFVVSNMDVFHTYKKLLPKSEAPAKKIKARALQFCCYFLLGELRVSLRSWTCTTSFFLKRTKRNFKRFLRSKP
jgi:phytoene dehydrogenase-like protein